MPRKSKKLSFYELKRMFKMQGYSVNRIARLFGVSPTKIYSELERTGLRPGDKTLDTSKSDCNKCMYRGLVQNERCCNYILITGRSRGCEARHCFRYQKGPQLKTYEDVRTERDEI